ncbi:MAG: DUF4167 domain-containing protein [Alphaproteobacteria bacterium]|nr:DUF4167 domain-containing protein [Alphaproteobacteria bacterium]MBV9905789.1 DUF4167 domain-containing protein [Alphaproteobacteria bacterium]
MATKRALKIGAEVKRSRRGGRRPQHGGGGGGQHHNANNNNNGGGGLNPNRTFDSNGPEVKIRGSASNVYEKYLQLARDANSSGDRVMAENYLQHAEHYYRIMAAQQAQMAQYQAQQQAQQAARAAQNGGQGGDGQYNQQPNQSAPQFSMAENEEGEEEAAE